MVNKKNIFFCIFLKYYIWKVNTESIKNRNSNIICQSLKHQFPFQKVNDVNILKHLWCPKIFGLWDVPTLLSSEFLYDDIIDKV